MIQDQVSDQWVQIIKRPMIVQQDNTAIHIAQITKPFTYPIEQQDIFTRIWKMQ